MTATRSVFGSLVHLGLMRGPADSAQQAAHGAAFSDWLGLEPEEKARDLQIFFTECADPPAAVAHWTSVSSHLDVIPADAGEEDRAQYLATFEAALEMMGPV